MRILDVQSSENSVLAICTVGFNFTEHVHFLKSDLNGFKLKVGQDIEIEKPNGVFIKSLRVDGKIIFSLSEENYKKRTELRP